MSKTSIAFIIGTLNSGGAERVVSTLSNEFAKKYRVTIITFVDFEPFYKLDDKIKVLSCYPKSKKSANAIQGVINNYGLYKKISKFIKEEKIELCIGFLTSSNIMAVLASRANNIPVIISERINPNATKKSFIWDKLRRYVYPKADFIIIQTEIIKSFFSSWVNNSKLIILPNPLSPDLKLPISSDTRSNVILNIGRLTDQKGQDVLIKIFSKLNPVNWQLIIVGEGPKRREYEDLIKDLKMTDKILLVGRQSNISKFYNNSKIFAFSSRFEGFPNALIEAMHMGVPCISTDCPTGPSELITDGENGFLVKMDNPLEMEDKLKQLLYDKQLREKFSLAANSTVLKFSIKNVAGQWDDVIKDALKKEKPSN
ncbi:glycosyltransferase family 4 protein [Zobellia barbeyronii]|uniref:Glycosyltransferase family 4 protein n=1 Tax=Zobellia barbeyronii TaxID=2748009 RepID=A0ABS5WIJ8_9FLAO|nr:glycosyltransferase family 4 protein [Zobellia barbeyronii]MBT2163200.1 glycosyltransferase family 4 protein [Zobellia barbeyronii]